MAHKIIVTERNGRFYFQSSLTSDASNPELTALMLAWSGGYSPRPVIELVKTSEGEPPKRRKSADFKPAPGVTYLLIDLISRGVSSSMRDNRWTLGTNIDGSSERGEHLKVDQRYRLNGYMLPGHNFATLPIRAKDAALTPEELAFLDEKRQKK